MSKAKGKFDAVLRARGGRGDGGAPTDTRATSLGKRSNADYRQVSAYIRKDTHRRVKMALLEEDREFSELVAELLENWLDERT